MRIVVTGGAGYLGCHLVPLLLEQGHEVRLFDRFCFGEGAISGFAGSPKCDVIRGDIRRLQEFPDLLSGVDGIVHLAGLANVPSCDLDADMTHDVNVESTRELASQAIQNGVKRFVLSSTCAVYGWGVFEFVDEESLAEPVSAFGASKLEAERAVLGMKNEHFEPVVARAATLYGWSPRMRFDLAVNLMAASAARNKVVSIYGGGEQWRPFVHVRDAARALAALLDAPAETVSGEVFNVGYDEGNMRIRELAERVAAGFGGRRLNDLDGEEDGRRHRVHFGKLRQRLNFQCTVSIEEGIEELKRALEGDTFNPFDEQYFNLRRLKILLDTPVEEGGEPIAPRFIPLSKPNLGEEEEQAVVATLRSGWLTSGPHVFAFEKAFAETVGASHVVAVTSCTAALHLCLAHLGVVPGDEVITSPLTYGSVGNVIINMGAKVVFADIDGDSLNIDPAAIEGKITAKTKVIMPVHMAGEPCDLDGVHAVAESHGIPVVEDAAHALGASYKGAPIGSHGEFACFSFYAIKNITTMEGGVITMKDGDTAARLRLLAGHGMSATAWERYGRSAAPSPPQVVAPGFKYAMGNVNAALGLEQLKRFPGFQAARRRLAGLYRSVLGDIDEIRLPKTVDEVGHAWHLMIIRLNLDRLTRNRDEIAHDMRQENVGTGFHFLGLHLHEYYRDTLGYRADDLPEATAASYEVLSLPLFPGMKDKHVQEVVAALKKVITHARKKG